MRVTAAGEVFQIRMQHHMYFSIYGSTGGMSNGTASGPLKRPASPETLVFQAMAAARSVQGHVVAQCVGGADLPLLLLALPRAPATSSTYRYLVARALYIIRD